MKALRQILVNLILAGYVFLAVFGLLAMSSIHHHQMASMDNCPFMVGEHSLCSMDFNAHITAWQNLSNAPTVELVYLIIPLFFVFFFFYLRPPNLARSSLYIKPLRESSITALFSQGILHPKAP